MGVKFVSPCTTPSIAGVKISEPFFLGKKINIRRVRTEQTTNHRLENPTPGMSQTI
jgi:hypothetical protein